MPMFTGVARHHPTTFCRSGHCVAVVTWISVGLPGGRVALVIISGCHWSYPTSASSLVEGTLVEYAQWPARDALPTGLRLLAKE